MTRAPRARLVASATLVAAAAGVLGPTAPASAASCTSGSGVTVVVDPGALGGVLTAVCDTGSGQTASVRYADAGVALTFVQRQPGFVCRVDGAPATDPCVNTPPTDAYWGLWWTDGESGTWSYSSLGVGGLQVPEGGAVALAWQQGARRTPALAAPVHATPSPSPTVSHTPKPSATASPTPSPTPSATPTTSTGSSSPTASQPTPTPPEPASSSASTSPAPAGSPSSSPSRTTRAKPRASRTPSTSPSDSAGPAATPAASDTTSTAADPADPVDQQGRVPTWVSLAVLGLLLVALAVMALAARRRRGDLQ